MFALLEGTERNVEINFKSFGGKIVLRKKACAFEWCLVSSQKYTKSFGGKILPCATDLSHQKSKYIV